MVAFTTLASDSINIIEIIIRMYNAFQAFWAEYGKLGLFIYSVVETITPISGVEVFFVSLVGKEPWWLIALIATLANVFGALIVYFFMSRGNHRIYNKILKADQQERAQRLFTRYGIWAIFIFAMTPLPFFVILFTGAIAKMKLSRYVLSVAFSRGFRFFLTTFILNQFTNVNAWQVIVILLIIAVPLTMIFVYIQKKALAHLEARIVIPPNDPPDLV